MKILLIDGGIKDVVYSILDILFLFISVYLLKIYQKLLFYSHSNLINNKIIIINYINTLPILQPYDHENQQEESFRSH